MELTEKEYAEFKSICKKQGIQYETEVEYREAANNLFRFVKLSYDLAKEHYAWEKRLENEPKGFAIKSNGRSCCLCHDSVNGEVWYDKWGMKCMTCQAALNKKIIPGYVFKDSDNNRHITASKLQWKYGLHAQTIRKLINNGTLKPRIIPQGITLFLKSENPKLPEILANVLGAKST
jgi:hypothetical protein